MCKNQTVNWIPASIHLFIFLKKIKDPEFHYYLCDLDVISIEKISVSNFNSIQSVRVCLKIIPTYDSCFFVSVIGLSIKNLLYRNLKFLKTHIPITWSYTHSVFIGPFFHLKGLILSKQLNDKERALAAIENNSIRNVVKFSCFRNIDMLKKN